jgi:cytochrome c oxidase assembly protein subunit 15
VNEGGDSRLAPLRKLLLATTIAVFFLIAVGGFVRAAGAGLGCEDWPKCFAWSWLPPTSVDDLPPHVDPATFSFEKAWIEYVNRLLGVVIGFLILGSFVSAWRRARARADVFRPVTWTLLLVAFQGWLGGQVVKMELDHRIVSLHLFVALWIAMLLVLATVNAGQAQPYRHQPESWSAPRRKYHRFAIALLVLVFVEEIVGAIVRGTVEGVEAAHESLPREELVAQVGWIYWVHRETALLTLLVAAAGILLAKRVAEDAESRLMRGAVWLFALVAAQGVAGLALAYLALPPAAQVAHVLLGALLVAVSQLQILRVRRLETA